MGCGTHQATIAYAMSRKHLSRAALPLRSAAHTSSEVGPRFLDSCPRQSLIRPHAEPTATVLGKLSTR